MVSGSQPLTDAQKNRANVLLSTRRSSPFLDEGASIAPTYHGKSLGSSFTDLGIYRKSSCVHECIIALRFVSLLSFPMYHKIKIFPWQ